MAADDLSESMLICPTFLRTLSLRKNDMVNNIPASLFSKVRALRVLDLSETSISTLSGSIECLKLLRVLNLNRTDIKEVPQCIRSLKNLRLLNMRGKNPIEHVPDWVSELKCLEILVVTAKSMPKTTSELLSLRVLRLHRVKLSVEENGMLKLEDVGRLISLQELNIPIDCEGELKRMEEGVLEHLRNMRRLTLWNKNDSGDVPLLSEKFKSMTGLEYLWLRRFNVPSSLMCEFVNLRFLGLLGCDCREYPVVESMPNLISLHMCVNDKRREVRELFGKRGAFPKLRFLRIVEFRMLEEILVLEGGSMPCLEEFRLLGCRRLRRVEGLEQLKSVKLFDFHGSGTDECRERLNRGGEQWNKIKANNPRVQIVM